MPRMPSVTATRFTTAPHKAGRRPDTPAQCSRAESVAAEF